MTRSAIYKKKITINKENTKFNFIHEEDLVSAMKNSLNKKVKGFKILNIFNNSKPQKLIILAKKIKKNIRISEKIKIHEINNPPNNHNPTEIIVSNLLTKTKSAFVFESQNLKLFEQFIINKMYVLQEKKFYLNYANNISCLIQKKPLSKLVNKIIKNR